MSLERTGREICLGTMACACFIAGCLGAENLGENAEDAALEAGQTSQAFIAAQTLVNDEESAAATCTVQTFAENIANDIAQIECEISDKASDGHSVYVDWSQDGFGAVRLSNHEGAGSTIFAVDARQNLDASFGEIRWKVCADVQLASDDCSRTQTYEL